MAAPLPFLLERFDAGPALTGTVIAVSTLSSMAGALAVPAVRGRMNQAMIIAVVQGGGPAEVDAAVEAAHAAFEDDWRWRTAADRAALLLRGADLLEAHAGNGHIVAVDKMDSSLGEGGDVLVPAWLSDVSSIDAGKTTTGGCPAPIASQT